MENVTEIPLKLKSHSLPLNTCKSHNSFFFISNSTQLRWAKLSPIPILIRQISLLIESKYYTTKAEMSTPTAALFGEYTNISALQPISPCCQTTVVHSARPVCFSHVVHHVDRWKSLLW